jgi:hypothetical protein
MDVVAVGSLVHMQVLHVALRRWENPEILTRFEKGRSQHSNYNIGLFNKASFICKDIYGRLSVF